MKVTDVSNHYVKGVSTILHDYLPIVFPADCLSCEADELSYDAYSVVKWSLKVLLKKEEHVFTIEDGLEIVPRDGIIQPFSKEIFTPLILIERKHRIIKDIKGNNNKYMDLNDFFVIRGAYLAKALMIASLIIESFFRSENEGKSKEDRVKKPTYFLREDEEIERAKEFESFRLKLAMTLNHTLRGTESFPVFLEDASGEIKQVRWIKCHGFLPLLVKNQLHLESEKRKVVYHSEKVSKKLRLPHFSHLGRLDMLETPESESIGLTLFLARGAEVDPASLEIQAPERDLLKKNPELAFSLSSSCVPFLNHSDGPRVSMGGKNLKQAIPVIGAERPMITTGVEEQAGLDFGVNALVGYMLFKGLNFEDGLVISRSFAQKMAVIKVRDVKSAALIDFFKRGAFDSVHSRGEYKFFHSMIDKDDTYRYRVTYKYKFKGAVRDGEPLLMMSVEKSKLMQKGERGKKGAVYANKWVQEEFSIKENDELKTYTTKVLVRHRGLYPGVIKDVELNLKKLDYAQILKINGSTKKTDIESCEVIFKVEESLPFEIGDKITGRHGNKATVSKILPDNEMPKVIIDGKACVPDALISPMSVMSRMNLGQLLEVHMSVAYGEKSVRPFEPVDQKDLLQRLMARGADEWGYFKLEDGRRVTAGYQYMVRLDHCVRNKLHVVKQASVSTLNAQPLKGRKRFGGQRIGEMEFWTLFNHKAFNVIEDFARTNLLPEDEKMAGLYSEFQKKHTQMMNGLLTMTTYEKTDAQDLQSSEDFKKAFSLSAEPVEGTFTSRLMAKYYDRQLFKENYDPEIFDFMNKKKNIKKAFRLLKGKDGYLRKHMLGRRIHFSGRSTISPVPELAIEHVFLPVDFGIEWFAYKSGLEGQFSKDEIQRARKGDTSLRKRMASKLSEYVNFSNFLVILNRQPSLHRHSMQAFFPEFWEHYSIGLPTLVCEGFGADFDGDTMACYFPVSQLSDDDDLRDQTHGELLNMLPTKLPYRLGDRGLAWSNGQDFAFGQFVIDQTGKNGVKEHIAGIVKESDYNKTLNHYTKRILKQVSDGELSISFFDIATPLDGEHPGPFLPIFKSSGARGKDEQFVQMAKGINILGPDSKKNFGMGLDIEDYICTRETDHLDIEDYNPHPIAIRSRRNLMEKKLSVASAGYFTRKLVSFLYPYVVKVADCGTDHLLEFSRDQFEALKEAAKGEFSLKRLILGRYILRNGALVLVDESVLRDIENEDWQLMELRSPITCECEGGVCSKCYGADLSKPVISEKALPGIGDFVGLSSGHSLGEFGTQLSMKTFQTGKAFTPDELSRLFFSRTRQNKERINDYYHYLLNIANQKAGDSSLFDAIGTFSIHLEVLYAYLVEKGIHSEAGMKKMFKKIDEMGLLSSLSFESFEGIFKKMVLKGESEVLETVEFSPSVGYMFANPVKKKVINNG